MRISDVVVFRVEGRWTGKEFPPGDRQARALDVYPEFGRQELPPRRGDYRVSAFYVEIQTEGGVSGLYGPIEKYQAFVILSALRPFLIGKDALATELLLDQMMRLDRHGRSGWFMTGVSAVDCALWDLKGKAWGKPVYRLLGGPTRRRIPAYASMLGFSVVPEKAAAAAAEYKARGFRAQKWFFRYGPGDGQDGLEKNLAMARAVREAVGDRYPLMFDAFMGWDLPYAVQMLQALEPLHPVWVEEPIPPERVGSFRRLRSCSRVPVATGEHVYTRWQVRELLVSEALDVVQTDPDWTGGISELVKICSLASSFDVPVVAHGHSLLPALHVAAAHSPASVPQVEYLIRHQEAKQFFHKPAYRPVAGEVEVPDLPGLGLVLDSDRIEAREPITF